MKPVWIRPAAREDLYSIWAYSATRWGTRQADRYVGSIDAAIAAISIGGSRSREADDLYPGLRSLRSGRHIVFFLDLPERIEIVRILHDAMDPDRHLAGD